MIPQHCSFFVLHVDFDYFILRLCYVEMNKTHELNYHSSAYSNFHFMQPLLIDSILLSDFEESIILVQNHTEICIKFSFTIWILKSLFVKWILFEMSVIDEEIFGLYLTCIYVNLCSIVEKLSLNKKEVLRVTFNDDLIASFCLLVIKKWLMDLC